MASFYMGEKLTKCHDGEYICIDLLIFAECIGYEIQGYMGKRQ